MIQEARGQPDIRSRPASPNDFRVISPASAREAIHQTLFSEVEVTPLPTSVMVSYTEEIWQAADTKFIIFPAPSAKLELAPEEEVKHISNESLQLSLRVSTWTTFQLFPS
ncbi:hypothetical protein K0M31_002374 [Melipona bicolor]|uniref:Uncharacterized protein n=1 Tax=Melipona bicolor TaxID=60889 RepID=A0AA40GHE8_9HYME|nr:hypothetical protein K0M31_002374 [Melipona bicolor]